MTQLGSDADDLLARLDERLHQSPVRDGWLERTHYLDAQASLWLEGDLVGLEDLVLHDAAMDIRTPTHELVRAHMKLRARRRIAAASPGWAFDAGAHDVLLGHVGYKGADAGPLEPQSTPEPARDPSAELEEEFALIDALIARTSRVLKQGRAPEDARRLTALEAWRVQMEATTGVSPVVAAAKAGLAWEEVRPVESGAWLGRLLAADLLRVRRKTQTFLCPLSLGLKAVPRSQRQSRDVATRLGAWIDGFAQAAQAGLRDHDRWLAIQRGLEHKVKDRRSRSKLPGLIPLVMSRPIVSSGMIAEELGVSARAAQDFAGQLGLREMTGRSRYRAWGIL